MHITKSIIFLTLLALLLSGTCLCEAAPAPFPDMRRDLFEAGDVPDKYLQPCTLQGRVERVRYSAEYNGETDIKRAIVYLPWDYDYTNSRYNVLYVLHCAGGGTDDYLSEERVTTFQCLLDNMIMNGIIAPVIVVAVSYYPNDTFAKLLPLEMQVKYASAFPETLTGGIIPAVEGKYRTYAESTEYKGITASRRHRAISGFSLGGTAVWYTFIQKMDAFYWYMPISEASWDDGEGGTDGIWDSSLSARVLFDAVLDQGYGRDDFSLFVATGTDDTAFEITTNQMKALLEYTDVFVTGRNTNCSLMKDGLHLFTSMYTYMYHILPELFDEAG